MSVDEGEPPARRVTPALELAEQLERRLLEARRERREPAAGSSVEHAPELLAELRRSRGSD